VSGWDEFQEIPTWSGRSRPKIDVLALMRATWQRHERVAFIVSGSAPSVLRVMINRSSSPFFQHFSIMEIGEMARPDAVALLTDSGIPAGLAERAVDVFGGQPFSHQMPGEELTASEEPWDETTLEEAIQRLLFNRAGRLALFFERELHTQVGNSALLAHLLETLAQAGSDGSRLVDLARAINSPSGATRGYIERLGDVVIQAEEGRPVVVGHRPGRVGWHGHLAGTGRSAQYKLSSCMREGLTGWRLSDLALPFAQEFQKSESPVRVSSRSMLTHGRR
jgi:hypothetical protein